MNYSDTTVIIPTLNEEGNIGDLIKILSKYTGISVIVADDGSKDRTQQIVKNESRKNRKIMLLDRSAKSHGLTASVVDGGIHAKTEFMVVIDGDLQHPPEKIKDIVEKLRNGSDICIASRQKVAVKWQFSRKMESKIATILAWARLLKPVKDPLSGFFGAKTLLFQQAVKKSWRKFEMPGYKVLFDLLKYAPRGSMISEVPYTFGLRMRGESKISKKHVFSFLRAVLK
jgi:dolichol-phosphate mannosyltransferase